MNILVTGANGFIGAYLCKCLIEHDFYVNAMVRKTSNLSLLKDLIPNLENNSKIKLVFGDVVDLESIKQNITDVEYIFNIAGVIKGLKREDFNNVNVNGSLNIIKAIIDLKLENKIKKVIFISSAAAAGPSAVPLSEDQTPNPIKGDLYGESKFKMEEEVLKYKDQIPIVIIRPPTVLGGGDLVSVDLFKVPKKGFKLIVGRKPKYYSIVDVRDLVDALYKIALSPTKSGDIFYVTSVESIEWGLLQEIIAQQVFNRTKKLRKLVIPEKIAIFLGSLITFFGKIFKKTPFLNKPKMLEAAAPSWINSRKKLEQLLGWKPKYSIEEIVKDAGEWYKNKRMI